MSSDSAQYGSELAAPILAFGAHPDDIEFGCGGVIAAETQAGRKAHFAICSLGEAASNGTPELRAAESRAASELLGATCEFVQLDGDGKLEIRASHAIELAQIIRKIRPSAVLATTWCDNQHPDHARLGQLARDAARLARYGGLEELKGLEPHAIEQLFFYAVTPEGEPPNVAPILIDISATDVINAWQAAMSAHVTQAATRDYIDLQLNRARLWGARAGVAYATALFPNEPLLFQSLRQVGKGARQF
ncbi:MAG: PIG-L family deacetylase [Candidatus Melainabacteria bacterium]|nr:PIG-L family deacetylase [Candidatus Melainabacteria bacterium]